MCKSKTTVGDSSLWGCDAVSMGKYFPMFQRNITRSFSGSSSQRRRAVWKGKVYYTDEGSAFLQNIGSYLTNNTASSGNLNLQQHRCDTEISMITVVNMGL